MEIRVTDTKPGLGQRVLVQFSAIYGEAAALWGSSKLPQIGSSYDVEFEIPGVFTWGDTITQSQEACHSIAQRNGCIVLSGVVSSVGEDGVAGLRIGDSIILVETLGVPPGAVDLFVEIVADLQSVKLLNTNL